MRSGLQQGAQKVKAEVSPTKDVRPVPGPVQWPGPSQIVHFAGSDNQLLWDATRPLQDRVPLGRPPLLAVLGPAVSEQRELDQTGIDHGNASELSAHPPQPWPVSLQDPHPGLNHLGDVPLRHAIGQGIEGDLPPSAACSPVCSMMVRTNPRSSSVPIT